MEMIKSMIFLVQCLFFLFFPAYHSVCASTSFEFRIPSNATSTTSRFYYTLIKQFESLNPDIKIELLPSNTWDQVTKDVIKATRYERDAGVFISEVSTTWELEKTQAAISIEYAINNYGKDLFGEIKDFKNTLVSEAMLENSYGLNGELYCLPFIRSTPIAFYNLDQLEKIGYTEASLPETWDEMIILLKKYKKEVKEIPFGFGAVWYDYLFEATVRQAGGSLMKDKFSKITFNAPEAIEALTFWKQLQDQGLMKKTNTWKSTINGFSYGHYPVIYYSSGGLGVASKIAQFRWAVKVMPKKLVHGVAFGGGNLYLSSYMPEKKIRAALKFVHFLYSQKVQTALSEKTGFFPVTKEALAAISNIHLNSLKHQFTNKQVYGKIMSTEYLKTRNILKQAIDKALYENVSPKAALDRAQLKIEKLLKKQ